MNINETWFHDVVILKVTENPEVQSIDFLLNYPIDWENNIYAHRILRFTDVTNYHVKQIPFGSPVTILEVVDKGKIERTIGSGGNTLGIIRNIAEIQTNAGTRIIEYADFKLFAEV